MLSVKVGTNIGNKRRIVKQNPSRNAMKIYTSTCSICNAPARNSICSNPKCKSWAKYRQHAAKCKTIEQGTTNTNPIPVCWDVDSMIEIK
jgi:hypothetical protein